MSRLLTIETENDIPETFRKTPMADLLLYQNAGKAPRAYERAEIMIGTCMDFRIRLDVPEKFAFFLRAGGANLSGLEFYLSTAIAVWGLDYLALVGHTCCGMSGIENQETAFVEGLVQHAGWPEEAARAHFKEQVKHFEVGDVPDFILRQTAELSHIYPKLRVAPLLYKVEDHRLYWIADS